VAGFMVVMVMLFVSSTECGAWTLEDEVGGYGWPGAVWFGAGGLGVRSGRSLPQCWERR